MTGHRFRFSPRGAPSALAALLLPFMLVALACGGATAAPAPQPTAEASAGDGIRPILATRELRVGSQRVSFLLAGPRSIVRAPEARVTARHLDAGGPAAESQTAVFHLWPYGIRGAYSTQLAFDRPGRWRLEIAVENDGGTQETSLDVEVARRSRVPDIGQVPPRSRTKTLDSAGRLEELTTDYTPDPDLYRLSIADAMAGGKPSVIVFATPAFCTSATCGPQVDTLSELKDAYPGQASYIHVELYDNPGEIQGDLSKAELADAVEEWGFTRLPVWLNESWTYVLDSQGRVIQRFEGFVTLEELEESLQQALTSG